MRRWATVGMGFVLALCLFTSASAEVYNGYYRSVLDLTDDFYVAPWGDTDHPKGADYGIHLTVMEESVSAQWIDLFVQVDYPIIRDRQISKFYILGNGKIIDSFRPQFYDGDGDGIYEEYRSQYTVKPTFTEAIGSVVSFTILGIQEGEGGEYIVAWSKMSDPVYFDPLPVRDREAISWLEQIYYLLESLLAKLNELLNMLASKLDDLKKAVEDIYTPRSETLQQFDQAVDNLMEKMPFEEMKDHAENITKTYDDTRKKLQQPGSKFVLGGEFYLIPEIPGLEDVTPAGKVAFIDLTQFKEQVKLFRDIMRWTLWLFFFHMLFMWLRPKMRF